MAQLFTEQAARQYICKVFQKSLFLPYVHEEWQKYLAGQRPSSENQGNPQGGNSRKRAAY